MRLGDYCGEAIPHFCISGSNNVFVNGKQICRQGDSFSEGKILIEGSKTVFANGFGIGRVDTVLQVNKKITKIVQAVS